MPVESDIIPVEPREDVPVERDTDPLMPTLPAFNAEIEIAPLDVW
jgi:hypothetical protein